MSKKPIIVFEGIEGSGKSHHISKVSKYLKEKKISYIMIREPGGNVNSEKIRKLILNNKSDFNENTDLLLYMAARSENIDIIRNSYKKKVIIIDRFTDSTIAYQHYGMGVSINLIKTLNKFLLKNIKVSFTFLNTVNQANLQKRLDELKLVRVERLQDELHTSNDMEYLEIVARDKLNMKMPGEVIFRIQR